MYTRGPRVLFDVGRRAALVTLTLAFAAFYTTASAQPAPPNRPAADAPVPRVAVRAEWRERAEAVSGAGYAADRKDVFLLSRLRVTLTASPWSSVTMTGQIQDARVADKDVGPAGVPFSAPIDVRLAQLELRPPGSPLSVIVGRQELAFGEQRLVGHVSWANAARTFDALRVRVRRDGLEANGFVSSVVRIRTDDWDRSGLGNQFHGVYVASTGLVPRGTVEPYGFWRQDRNQRTDAGPSATARLTTLGVRVGGTLRTGVSYGLESVMQRGSVGREAQRAYAQHLRLRWPVLSEGTRLTAEYNYASGDASAGDGRHGTFDPLYPTPHDKYGLADQVGWRNIHHIRMAVDVTAARQTPVTLAYHSWWLASRTDALYNAPGAVVARIPTGAPSSHVGQGVDAQVVRALTGRVQAAGGYAWIHSGGFLEAATPGANFQALYLMLTVTVAAER